MTSSELSSYLPPSQVKESKLFTFFSLIDRVERLKEILTHDNHSYYKLDLRLFINNNESILVSIGYDSMGIGDTFDYNLECEIYKDRINFFTMLVNYLKDDNLKNNLARFIRERNTDFGNSNQWYSITEGLEDIKGYRVEELKIIRSYAHIKLENDIHLCVGLDKYSYIDGVDISRVELLQWYIHEVEKRNLDFEPLEYLKEELQSYANK